MGRGYSAPSQTPPPQALALRHLAHPDLPYLEMKLTFECTSWFYGLAPPLPIQIRIESADSVHLDVGALQIIYLLTYLIVEVDAVPSILTLSTNNKYVAASYFNLYFATTFRFNPCLTHLFLFRASLVQVRSSKVSLGLLRKLNWYFLQAKWFPQVTFKILYNITFMM